jgi:hypothetical protein
MRKILFALAFITTHFTTSAQGIIPFIGGNLSGYQIKQNNYASGGVPGLNIGAIADLRMSSLFSFQPGLQYAMTGGKISITHPGIVAPPTEYKYRVNSVQLPVMLVLKTGVEDQEHFFAGVGFYVSANLGGQLSAETAFLDPFGNTVKRNYTQNLTFDGIALNSMQRFDFGLSLGAGYHMAVGPELYFFYQKGTVDMLSQSYVAKSTTYQLGVAARYELKLQKKKAAHKGPR